MKKGWILVLAAMVVLGLSISLFAQAGNKYVGVEKCKLCHQGKTQGEQFAKWQQSRHSQAYKTLATLKAKEIAAGLGIDDPQKSEQCLKCHSTASGVSSDTIAAGSKLKIEDGVQCESCHGAGEKYWSIPEMKDRSKAVAAGLVEINQAVCVKCHNEESPVFKGFDYAQYLEKIAHPRPK